MGKANISQLKKHAGYRIVCLPDLSAGGLRPLSGALGRALKSAEGGA